MSGEYLRDSVTRMETNLDDLSPEITGAVMEMLFAAGALDVWFAPIQMKKNRPGVQISVLCENPHVDAMADILFRETSAFGLRVEPVLRLKLERRFEDVQTQFGTVRLKLGLKGDQVLQVAPEFESCRAVSQAAGVPLRTVYAAAMNAARPREI